MVSPPGMVCYAEKQEKPFWFSSLDQIVHFDAIIFLIFCRTFVELFWSVRVDRKKKSHYNSRVSLHEAPTKNKLLIQQLCSPKIRLAVKRELLASKQGQSLLRLLKTSVLRYLKLQCYEQANKAVCTCAS